MPQPTDVHCEAAALYFLPVPMRVPLKFGAEVATEVLCARVCLTVSDAQGLRADGWGETPLSVTWVWPSTISLAARLEQLKRLCVLLVEAWARFEVHGHPIEIGYAFQQHALPGLLEKVNRESDLGEPMPLLAALVCCSAFDIALHDAYGNLHQTPIYQTYNARFMSRDLAAYLTDADGKADIFAGKYPQDYFVDQPPSTLPAWHLVGGLDLLDPAELTGTEPDDGYPVLLSDWIQRDGLNCLKIKLRGNDADWDYQRIVAVGQMAIQYDVDWLTADFNCTVTEPAYVNAILDQLVRDEPRIFGMILYVEQPFAYDLEANPLDVHSVSARKPLFMDESAHHWELVKLGRTLGWTGVALKTCKTQTAALLSLCWAKAHGMTLMVQDLTNPMLAQIPHVLLAAHASTIMGVETNAMQFYPEASRPEQQIHPGLYQRRSGQVDLTSVSGPGFGYHIAQMQRDLPAPAAASGTPAASNKM
jgi:L-alanine-DL-glutamate epimerase-like enolase superfamily enzyme